MPYRKSKSSPLFAQLVFGLRTTPIGRKGFWRAEEAERTAQKRSTLSLPGRTGFERMFDYRLLASFQGNLFGCFMQCLPRVEFLSLHRNGEALRSEWEQTVKFMCPLFRLLPVEPYLRPVSGLDCHFLEQYSERRKSCNESTMHA